PDGGSGLRAGDSGWERSSWGAGADSKKIPAPRALRTVSRSARCSGSSADEARSACSPSPASYGASTEARRGLAFLIVSGTTGGGGAALGSALAWVWPRGGGKARVVASTPAPRSHV